MDGGMDECSGGKTVYAMDVFVAMDKEEKVDCRGYFDGMHKKPPAEARGKT